MSYVVIENNCKLSFYESLSLTLSNNLRNYIDVKQLSDGNVFVKSSSSMNPCSIPLQRPSFCPIVGLKQSNKVDQLHSKLKWIATASVVILENPNGLVLLTRRPSNMRTFPNVWVAPGGNIESNETLEAAALRELSEETGIKLSADEIEMSLMCAWESAFPTILHYGMPKSHHLVLYYKVVMKNTKFDYERLLVNVNEVSAYCWLNRDQVAAVVKSFPDLIDANSFDDLLKTQDRDDDHFENIEVKLVNDNLEYFKSNRPMSVLTTYVSDIQQLHLIPERVSTGTKFALYEWLKGFQCL